MKKQKPCKAMVELGQLVAKARPDISELSRYYLTELLWGMLACAMRYADETRDTSTPEGKNINILLDPFLNDILDADYTTKDLEILHTFLFGKKRRLPFGTITVDTKGTVTQLKTIDFFKKENLSAPQDPEGYSDKVAKK